MTGRRDAVAHLKSCAAQHAGLWLDKYISGYTKPLSDDPPQANLVRETCGIPEPPGYEVFFRRWEQAVKGLDGAQTRYAQAVGRLAIGLGGESVLETSIALHRTYGVPYIPGSALKGLASAYAHQYLEDERWRKGGEAHVVMFGDTKRAGYVTFFDALYVPGSGLDGRPLWPDVITVHHPKYYQGSGASLAPPADWDSPNPVPFLTATGTYLLALAGPRAWVDAAFGILETALRDMGIGAKTSSGYGRMALVAAPAPRRPSVAQRPEPTARPDASSGVPASTHVPPSRPAAPRIPQIGDVFTGEILEIEKGNVIVAVPRFDPQKALGIIRAENVGGRRYRVGNMARVEVLRICETKTGCTVLELKPAPRPA